MYDNVYVRVLGYKTCLDTKPVSTVSEVRCDCQGLGLVARIEASILVFDTKHVLYWPVLGQIQFCSFDRRYKTCLDTKPVLYQGRFCSLTSVDIIYFALGVLHQWTIPYSNYTEIIKRML